MAVSTIVIIILSILVLIALIFIFNQQTRFFSDFINNIIGKTNVDSIVTACNSLASSNYFYEYCCVEKEVRYKKDKELVKEEMTCKELADKEIVGGRINKINCQEAGC